MSGGAPALAGGRGVTMAEAVLNPEPFGTFRPGLLWRMLIGRRDFGASDGVSRRRARRSNIRLRKTRRIFDVVHDGIKLRLYPSENLCDRKLIARGDHPVHAEMARARGYLESAQVFVDIGANIGLYCLVARKMMPSQSRLIAFEPDPRTVLKLRQNLSYNAADNVEVFNLAVGARDEVLVLRGVAANNAGRKTLAHDASMDAPGVSVPVRPLIDVLDEQGVERIDVLKIDVEGFEDQALIPFLDAATPAMLPRYIMIETNSRPDWGTDVIERLLGLGYVPTFETKNDMHLARDADGAPAGKTSESER